MSIRQHIPNILTLINLLCGCLGVFFVTLGQLKIVFVLLGISLIADFLDGFVARLLGVSSPIGAELDSLADMVSFGVLPGFLMFALMLPFSELDQTASTFQAVFSHLELKDLLFAFSAFLIPLFSGLRLAKFNISEDQDNEFRGLATPAATALVTGLTMAYVFQGFVLNNYLLALIVLATCVLLVSNIPMFSFKLKNWHWKSAKWHYVFISLTLISIIIFKFAGVAVSVAIYIVLNIIRQQVNRISNV